MQALGEHSARQLRLMFLLQKWHKPMNFSDATVVRGPPQHGL